MIQAKIIQLLITNIAQFLTAWNESSLLQLLYEHFKRMKLHSILINLRIIHFPIPNILQFLVAWNNSSLLQLLYEHFKRMKLHSTLIYPKIIHFLIPNIASFWLLEISLLCCNCFMNTSKEWNFNKQWFKLI
jgi:hypothetical protein